MPLLNNAQRAALRRAQAAANEALPRIEFLEQIALHHPPIVPTVKALRDKREWIKTIAGVMLELDRTTPDAA